MPQDPSPEFIGQVLNDIMGDLAKMHEIVSRMLYADDPGTIYPTEKPDWRELEALKYAEAQLAQKIKYIRGERY